LAASAAELTHHINAAEATALADLAMNVVIFPPYLLLPIARAADLLCVDLLRRHRISMNFPAEPSQLSTII
jgi:hypothetical protein